MGMSQGEGEPGQEMERPKGLILEKPPREHEDELLEWLGRNDATTLGERVERLRFLVGLNVSFGPGWIGFYGQTGEYLEYAARCYLEGLFVPCIAMCQTAAEEQMRGLVRSFAPPEVAEKDLAARPMSEVLRDRWVRSAFPGGVLKKLEAMRGLRNAYIHPPSPLTPEGGPDSRWLPNREVAQKKAAAELREDDARGALKTLATFLTVIPGVRKG